MKDNSNIQKSEYWLALLGDKTANEVVTECDLFNCFYRDIEEFIDECELECEYDKTKFTEPLEYIDSIDYNGEYRSNTIDELMFQIDPDLDY